MSKEVITKKCWEGSYGFSAKPGDTLTILAYGCGPTNWSDKEEQWKVLERSEERTERYPSTSRYIANTVTCVDLTLEKVEETPEGQECECEGRGWEVMEEPTRIERCDLCKKFANDENATKAARIELTEILENALHEYEESSWIGERNEPLLNLAYWFKTHGEAFIAAMEGER